MTALNLEIIKQQLTDLNFIADNIRLVTVNEMPVELLENCTKTEGESFYNSYMNVVYKKADRYVLGYVCQDPLLDQAIIRIGDHYYDPTKQANEDFKPYQFAVLTEFTTFDMMKHAKKNKDFPPDIDYLISKKKHFKNVIKG
ncbi:hypothetical protein CW745_00265 [Psychromonas sp. psych-6C06]|uniref:hypothetical protein n=1 Tax=Psychromonas sp. psych-6C06 TaxID=2058089 RepID=UPI000C32BED1|nr:hypothetical protein [Psychromonas sp. psych-6C06]PKF63325.1 hypothetical protein CW745_00265 [Psychromonas sp. psych-6C06]